MKNGFIISLFLFGLMACNGKSEKAVSEKQVTTETERIERGAYLVNAIGCADCHSPKIMTAMGPSVDPNTSFGGHIEGDLSGKVSKDALANWVLFNMSLTAAVGPWGISYAANISSDESGIGNWTEEQFFRAMREGQYKGLVNSRKLLPPMPWENYKQISDEDMRAIFAYLKSTKPVRNIVPQPVTPENL
ncbi:MAG: hypothetical protein A2W90_17650 [Bacteroidetes bacterium GWF2_42_66]|nr:MAG: hypothetical protein A2W92_16695 [Bacteroidetes bacterium GWA2_42_15]OFX98083.1 MAG: hypothetical protein A2W89_09140 [Bacteroidetes bacterium GWE2_42_39]OFY42467.1 MAG: hypothetical protein A2W90_17650 [Bacteroidetes bacterium GWF2_42_66]HBL74178.1 diheme cytochrome c-553 [Prolixibacteraceae bacterium]HCR91664.1 diheme cytochrome c-553 [Prolixibacteraceae bacterium]